jgi:hypothetical protein
MDASKAHKDYRTQNKGTPMGVLPRSATIVPDFQHCSARND